MKQHYVLGLALLAAGLAALLVPGEFDLLLDHWAFFLPPLVIFAAVTGAGRHFGVPYLFRDDAQIFGPDPIAPVGRPHFRPLASPAFWSGVGFAGLFGYAWIIAHASGDLYCASGAAKVVCPTELYAITAGPARTGFLLLLGAILAAGTVFFLGTLRELRRRPPGGLEGPGGVPMSSELLRTGVGLVLGGLVAVLAYLVSEPRLPLASLPVPGGVAVLRDAVQYLPATARTLVAPDAHDFGWIVVTYLVAAAGLSVLWRCAHGLSGPALKVAAVAYAVPLMLGLLIVAVNAPEVTEPALPYPPRVAGIWIVAWIYLMFVVATFVIRSSLPCVSIVALSVSLLTICLVWPLALDTAARELGKWQLAAPGFQGNRLIATFFIGVGAIAFVTFVNGGRFRYRLPGFGDAYDNPVDPEAEVLETVGPIPALVAPVDALGKWREKFPAEAPPILVCLAVSGGAYRATFWTSVLLDKLTADVPGLAANVRLITGASGGMVAGAYFAALRRDGDTDFSVTEAIETDTKDYMETVELRTFPIKRDSLSAVVHQMVQWDIRDAFLPGPPVKDRGRSLEAQWTTLTGTGSQPRSFAWLHDSVARGEAPALIVSPMLVESGAPAIFSNLDLAAVRGKGAAAAAPGTDPSATSVEIFKVFGDAYANLTLATAVRMNASFPYVSPAISLPTEPSRRAVDAGYYDNFGVDLLTDYLEDSAVFDWIKRNCRGVAVIQVRAFPSQVKTPPKGRRARAFQFLTSPFEGLASARRASQMFRNDQQLALTQERYGRTFLEIFTFEADAAVSMSWYLRNEELNALKARANDGAISDEFAALDRFWSPQWPAERETHGSR